MNPNTNNGLDICFSNRPRAALPIDTSDINQMRDFRRNNPHIIGNFVPAGTPIIFDRVDAESKLASRPDLTCSLAAMRNWTGETKRNVSAMNAIFGDEQLQAIAQVYEKEIQPYVNKMRNITEGTVDELTGIGAGATAINAKEVRLSNFGQALFKYQKSLLDIHQATKNRTPKLELIKLGNNVKEAHTKLNSKFTRELKHFSGVVKARKRGNIWSNPQRGINIARSGRDMSRLQLTSLSGVRSIKALERASGVLGNGVIALDAGLRIDSVYQDYRAGKDWQRSAVMQTTGFGFGTAAGLGTGISVVKAGAGIALALGPVGWVILIGVSVGAGYLASKEVDKAGQWFAGVVYDGSKSYNW